MMVDDAAERYLISDLENYSENELIERLKLAWGYSKTQPFDLIGRLKEIPGRSISFLEELHSVNDGSALLYPLQGADIRHTVYVGRVNQTKFGDETADGKWVTARVQLSPERERKRHSNPFGLAVVNDGLQLLQSIPEDATNIETVIDNKVHFEKWILDFYRDKHQKQILEEGENLRAQLEKQNKQEETRIAELKDEAKDLSDKVANQKDSLKVLEKDLVVNRQLRDEADAEFNHRKKYMEHQLSKLQLFIDEKAKLLLELDLIDKEDLDSILGSAAEDMGRDGHDFAGVFSSDIVQAVSYVQAYMWKKGVVYSRKVLEDFCALLSTHDLIILAGDSGAGKTNLVKSFAEAIGGEAVVVPVKPNWTSAEDLLGYYNPLEQKYLSTPFLDALFEAARNPDVPYLICLDEMNLARVEYYFADFLSLMEERDQPPEIYLYSDTEAGHLISEAKNFLALVDEAKSKSDKLDVTSFLELMRDKDLNAKLHELCGFQKGDSLLKYHAHLRKLINSYLTTPSAIRLPLNVRIIGTINMDETTHYLSPKILDRSHILRFASPLLADWSQVEAEVEDFKLDLNLPVQLTVEALGGRVQYPFFDRSDPLVEILIHVVRDYLEPLGIEFGLRTVRQACHYSAALKPFGMSENLILNNIILHKILPKLMFDGEKKVDGNIARKDLLIGMKDFFKQQLSGLGNFDAVHNCNDELDRVIRNAEANDWVVNYWSR